MVSSGMRLSASVSPARSRSTGISASARASSVSRSGAAIAGLRSYSAAACCTTLCLARGGLW